MWQRFTELARRAVFHAQEEALGVGEGYVSTEHLLLGCLREDNGAIRVLAALGVSATLVRAEIVKQLLKGDARPPVDMSLTPRAKRCIDLAYDEASNLGHNYIATEHLLIGFVREGEGLAGRVLKKLGVELEAARNEVIRMSDAEGDPHHPPHPAPGVPRAPKAPPAPHAWSAYDPAAQAAILRAVEIAGSQGEVHLTPLHLILALLEDPQSPASAALRRAGAAPEDLTFMIEAARTWAAGAPEIPLSPNGRKAIDMASMEARIMNSDRLGPEHLLIGLARGNPAGVGELVQGLGVSTGDLRKAVREGAKGKE